MNNFIKINHALAAKKTKLFTLLLALIASVGTMFAWDYERVQIGDLYYNLDTEGKTAEVTHQNAFEDDENYAGLKSANIPDAVVYDGVNYRVTSIGSEAFSDCWDLKEVTIPNSIEKVGFSAFLWNYFLEAVYISDLAAWSRINFSTNYNGSNPLIYADYLYVNGVKTTNIVIPDGVTTIGDGAFQGYTAATSIYIPESVINIGEDAFKGCTGLITLTIPNTVVSVGRNAFYNIANIEYHGDLDILNNGKSINGFVDGYFVYSDETKTELRACSSAAKGIISIPESVNSIKSNAFSNCSNITSLNVPNSVTEIGYNAFNGVLNVNYNGAALAESYNWYAKNLNKYAEGTFVYENDSKTRLLGCPTGTIGKICIPEGVVYVKSKAFQGCAKLQSVKIPKSVQYLCNDESDNYGFSGCRRLKSLVFYSQTPPSTRQSKYVAPKDVTLYVPEGCVEVYTQSIKLGWEGLTIRELISTEKSISTTSVSIKITNNNWEVDGDNIASCGIEGGEAQAGNILEYISLEPETEYKDIPVVLTSNTGETETVSISFTTTALELNTQPAHLTSETSAILIANTNMADIETSCGFEFRRTGASEDVPSQIMGCPVANGTMAVKVKNLKAGTEYKYRPFYKSASEKMYYGDWKAFDPQDAYITYEPVIYTYAASAVTEHEATLKGYALEGSDDFTEQGFEYWADSRIKNNMPGIRYSAQLGDKKTVTATGISMKVTLTNLDQGTVYKYRTFAKMGDQIVYGSEMSFTTQGEWVAFTVTFLDKDGKVIEVQEVEAGTDAIAPQAPEVNGYKFIGWDKDITNVQSDLTVTAQYEKNEENPNEAIENVDANLVTPQKIMHNGVLYILRDGKTYTVQGQEVK